MTSAPVQQPTGHDRAHASVIPTVPGLPWYGAVLVALVLTVIGALLGGSNFAEQLPAMLWVFFLAGTVLAALTVRRRAVFTAMAQPPLIGACVIFLSARLFDGQETLIAAVNVVKAFPMMAVATGVAVVLGLVRIVAQPLRTGPPADPARSNRHTPDAPAPA